MHNGAECIANIVRYFWW